MKRLLFLTMALCGVTAFAADGIWTKTDTGTSPQTAADYSAPANWANGYVPGAGDTVYFTNAYATTRYVKLPSNLSVAKIYAARGSSDQYTQLLGDKLTLTGSTLSFKGKDALTQRIFADITAPEGLSLTHSGFCGDLTFGGAKKDLTTGGGQCHMDFSVYANSVDPVRSPLDINRLYAGSGELHCIGPAGLTGAVTGVWKVVPGSPYLTYVSGEKQGEQLAVGGALSGEGIPDGAFVKRIFSKDYIEMSAASTAAVETDSTVTFGSFVPEVTVHVPYFLLAATPTHYIERRNDASVLRMDVDFFQSASATYTLTLTVSSGKSPGTLVLHDADLMTMCLRFINGHVELAENPDGVTGIPNARSICLYNADSKARFTVTNGISAVISVLSNVVGTVTKDGAGVLTSRLVLNNTGTIKVEDGVFAMDENPDSSVPSIGTLNVAAGATFRLNGGTLKVANLAVVPGSVLDGPGVIEITGTNPSLAGVVLTGGVQVQLTGAKGAPATAVPTADCPAGDPVFWVDATRSIVADVDGAVTRWNDCRGSEADGYLFATNIIRKPTLTDGADGKYVNFAHVNCGGKPHWITNENVLVWSKLVKNVKAIFAVLDARDRGGYLLGHSTRPEICKAASDGGFFYRANSDWYYPIIHLGYCAAGDRMYVDGDPVELGAGFHGPGIQLVEYHTATRQIMADAFGTGYRDGGTEDAANGGVHAYEYVIYTNELSAAERTQTAQYLLKKWRHRDVALEETLPTADIGTVDGAADGGIAVAANETLNVDSLGAGTLMKGGAGSLFVKAARGGSLHVAAGTVVLRSKALTVENLPLMDGCWLHLDATQAKSLTTSPSQGTNFVTRWKDRRENGLSVIKTGSDGGSKTSDGWLHENVANGNPMVDLGEHVYSSTVWGKPEPFRALQIRIPDGKGGDTEVGGTQHNGENGPGICGVFIAYDSSQGGGALLSGRGSGHWTYGFVPYYPTEGEPPTRIFRPTTDTTNIGLMTLMAYFNCIEGNNFKECLDVRQNGDYFNPFKTDFSGGQDVFVYSVESMPRKTGSFGIQGYDNNVGGLMYGEVLLFTNFIGRANTRFVEKYLMKKWKGVDSPEYAAATLDTLTVDAGATVQIYGPDPLTLTALNANGGTIVGAVKMAANAVVEVPVLADGTLGTVTLGEDFDFSAGVAVRIVGNVNAVVPGTYTVVTSSAIAADATGWSLADPGAKKRTFGLKVATGKVQVTVSKLGMTLLIR